MRVVRDRADARWLPSRFRFALARLFAYIRLRNMPPKPEPGLLLAIDRDQSAIEQHFISIATLIVVAPAFAALLDTFMPATLAWILGIALTGFVVELPMYILGVALTVSGHLFGFPGENHLGIQSKAMMLLLMLIAAWEISTPGWMQLVGYAFLALVALNAIAAVVAFMLRRPMMELERRVGGDA